MSEDFEKHFRAVATVRHVARMVGLSPSRFYQLQLAGIFPMPLYDITTRRPHYTEEQQRECLEVRRRNCGINGKPILFYARRLDVASQPTRTRPKAVKKTGDGRHDKIIAGLKSLGLTGVSKEAVQAAVRKLFPGGTASADPGDVIRKVFLEMRQQNSGDSVGG
jgi:hypothetical protein